MKYYNSILDLIGKTPLVRIDKVNPNPNVLILAKLEKYNPSGSVKDRVAYNMILEAEKSGELTKDKIIIEPTSGNTGIGLAMVCAVKGYKLEIVMSESMSIERRKILTAYGAKITLTPGELGTNGAQDYVNKTVEENPDKYFYLNQFSNKANPEIHYKTTAEEILADTDGKIDVFIGGLGTSGTLMGVSKKLKEYNENIKIISVQPEGEQGVQGLKNLKKSYIPSIYDETMVDETYYVGFEKSSHGARMLALREGIFCGVSSGAVIDAARQVAKKMDKGVIVLLLPDGGEKYISNKIYLPDKCLECINSFNIETLWDEHYIDSIKDWWNAKKN